MADKQTKDGEDLIFDLVEGIAGLLWRLRTELLTTAVPIVGWLLLAPSIGDINAGLVVIWVIGSMSVFGPTRRWIMRRLYLSRQRRMWRSAALSVGLESPGSRLPVMCSARKIPAGDQLLIRVPRGSSVVEVEKRAEQLAATLGLCDVRVTRKPNNAAYATVVLVKQDSLERPQPVRWPHADAVRLSLWQPIPVGINEDGEIVTVNLPERNVLLGGEPGAGKSVALSMLVATAALDPAVKLWLLDGKQVELAAWQPVAARSVGPNIDDAIDALRELRNEMDTRYRHLLQQGLRKVSERDGFPLHVVVCDELAYYLTVSDRKQRNEFGDLMRDLVSRGRAAGIIVIAATQKPSHDIVPTSLRDLFGFRWAMRCNTPQASDTILGTGWASQGYDASTVPGAQRGVGYLHTEEAKPVRLLSYYIDDPQLEAIAQRAARLRTDLNSETVR